ncbi:MAG TPA: hypothetical protein VHW23_07405 [Kofleriaceae bacterium]|jgi:hypothetical protein|nr:hypothetical protein [Kofleriaceae bacterium]
MAIAWCASGVAAASPHGNLFPGLTIRCDTVKGASHKDTAEFEIGFDGSVHRNAVDPVHRNTVRILAGDFAKQRLAQLQHHVTVLLSQRSSTYHDESPDGDNPCKPDDLTTPILLSPDLAGDAQEPDHWRVVIAIEPQAALAVRLGRPPVKQGIWTAVAGRAVDNEKTAIERGLVKQLTVGGPPPSIEQIAKNVDALLPAVDQIEPAIQATRYLLGRDALEKIRTELVELRSAADAFGQDPTRFARALAAVDRHDAEVPETHCDDAWQYNIMQQAQSASGGALGNDETKRFGGWLFGAFDLPLSSAEDTVELGATGIAVPSRELTRRGPVTAWARQVSSGDGDIRFEWAIGAGTQPGAAAVIGAFVAVIKAGVVQHMLAASPAPSSALEWLTSRDHCKDVDIQVEYPLAPLSSSRSLVATSELERDHNYTVYACKGLCTTTGGSNTVVAKGQLTTPSSGGFTLIGSLSYNLHLHDGWRHRPGFTQYEWRATTASGSAQQIFELEQTTQPLQSAALALALAYRVADCKGDDFLGRLWCDAHFAVGFGPSIVYGDGSGKLGQWTGNLFFGPRGMGKKKLYFTLGYGFRFFNEPLVAREHDRMQAATAPSLPTRVGLEQVVMFGLAFDLTVIGDAASSVFGTKLTLPGDSAASSKGAQ